jgi:hypothetical protein
MKEDRMKRIRDRGHVRRVKRVEIEQNSRYPSDALQISGRRESWARTGKRRC